ncbi:MAG: putative Histidine kinase [Candidatus Thorarchaeota archaeon]|nr:MAG: putative Histidine kinase [Candidatus Thorarchaeota archaeon]
MISRIEISEQLQEEPLTCRSLIAAIKDSVNLLSQCYSDALVEIRYHTDSAVVQANDLLDEMIWNLLQNAVRHNPRPVKRIWVTLETVRDGYQVSISDNGPGITPEMKSILFDTSQRRVGIGIHQSCQILETYDGFLEVSDRIPGSPSQGSLFRFWIPSADISASSET